MMVLYLCDRIMWNDINKAKNLKRMEKRDGVKNKSKIERLSHIPVRERK